MKHVVIKPMKLISMLSTTALFVVSASAFAAPNHFEVLKDKYDNDTNSSITDQSLEGYYLGRCFRQADDTPIGMILSTRKNVVTQTANGDEGPDFPPVTTTTTTWQMVFALVGNVSTGGVSDQPASANDNQTAAQLAASWDSLLAADPGSNPVLSISNGVASSSMPSVGSGQVTYDVKRGNDKLFYGHIPPNNGQVDEMYCYFYQKLK